jgi:AraC family transcriptional regulator, regulatory protein of adaptative response / methylated-DNA-[protein]-cysteine methyltransferase
MYDAETRFEGIFFTAVHTTGIFCRPSCSARKPLADNVSFYASADEAMAAGFRPCRRCHPLEPLGAMPPWVARAFELAGQVPNQRVTQQMLKAHDIDPARLREWCTLNYGKSFAAILRSRRVGEALGMIRDGSDPLDAALEAGYESMSGFRAAAQRAPAPAHAVVPAMFQTLTTPLGPMVCVSTDGGLALLEFLDRPALAAELDELRARHGFILAPGTSPIAAEVQAQLDAYFAGTRKRFDVPLAMVGSGFDLAVWQALLDIPHGETATYGDMARRIGKHNAVRAVGRANGRNRISILVPCHRVIGANGKLVGYGGGQPRKQYLLDVERAGTADLFASSPA